MSEQYFVRTDCQIPKKSNSRLLYDIFEKFIDSNFKTVELNPELFKGKGHSYVKVCLYKYRRKHNLPLKVHCISNHVYLERI